MTQFGSVPSVSAPAKAKSSNIGAGVTACAGSIVKVVPAVVCDAMTFGWSVVVDMIVGGNQ